MRVRSPHRLGVRIGLRLPAALIATTLLLLATGLPAAGRAAGPALAGDGTAGRTTAGAAGGGGGTGVPSKVIVLGFDGADAQLVEQYMNEGYLPNLDRLRREGTFSPLQPTNPPQTPVSWSTFATGLDPGQHEIFDFLKRDPDRYTPDFAMMTPGVKPFLFGVHNPLYLGAAAGLLAFLLVFAIAGLASRRAWIGLLAGLALAAPVFFGARSFVRTNIPMKQPTVVNNRKGATFWQVLAEHGIRSTVIRVPNTFPPDANPGGRLLSGLGVPDIRGTFGTYTIYTSDTGDKDRPTASRDTEMGGKVVLLDVEQGDPAVDTFVYGPFNKLFDTPPEIQLPMRLGLDWGNKRVNIEVSGQKLSLKEGEWSDFIRLEFPIRRVVRVKGITRFCLLQLGPQLKLYMQAINFDPLNPVFPITYPEGFAKEIFQKVGLFKTLGWAMDTWALDEGVTTEKQYAEDRDFFVTKFETMMNAFISNPRDRLYVQVYYYTDRDGHMFWRFLDPGNPAYDPDQARVWGNFVRQSYQRMDAAVGKARAALPPDGVLLVCSDHGFSSWRRSFNINTWLVRNGFMVLRGAGEQKTLENLFVSGQFFENVDWNRTKAYALGLGCIYINVLGRERDGIVSPGAEYDRVCAEIKQKLEAFTDPETGENPVHRVYRRDEMYRDFDPDLIPDLRAANNLNYRVSWQTSLGGAPPDYFEKHDSPWSGDHCSLDPDLVRGIFFCNRRVDLSTIPDIKDIFPTLLDLFAVPVPAGLDGHALLEKTGS
jgi:predicted AlkP superfamily phosphohydrolase/phosphomutase